MQDFLIPALERIETMPVGRRFELSDIIPLWENIPKGERRVLGREFSALCKGGKIAKVALSGRGDDNHKIYVKLH